MAELAAIFSVRDLSSYQVDSLLRVVHQYARQQGKRLSCLYRCDPSLSVPVRDIGKGVIHETEQHIQLCLTVRFFGCTGTVSPLPTHMISGLCLPEFADSALAWFLDYCTHALLDHFFRLADQANALAVSQQLRYQSCALSLMGQASAIEAQDTTSMLWQYVPYFLGGRMGKGAFCHIVQLCLSAIESVWVTCFVRSFEKLDSDMRNRLGVPNSALGQVVLGALVECFQCVWQCHIQVRALLDFMPGSECYGALHRLAQPFEQSGATMQLVVHSPSLLPILGEPCPLGWGVALSSTVGDCSVKLVI